jgi:hypothetical protein
VASIEKASELLKGLSEKERSKQEEFISRHRGEARQGQRIAVVCPVEECDPRWRRFCSSEAEAEKLLKAGCPNHHRAVRQENKPYFDVSTV